MQALPLEANALPSGGAVEDMMDVVEVAVGDI